MSTRNPPMTLEEMQSRRILALESQIEKVTASLPSGIEAEVCRDIADRQKLGIAKYGVTVAGNPLSLRDWLQHAYQECLDQAVYLKRAMAEIDANTP